MFTITRKRSNFTADELWYLGSSALWYRATKPCASGNVYYLVKHSTLCFTVGLCRSSSVVILKCQSNDRVSRYTSFTEAMTILLGYYKFFNEKRDGKVCLYQ